MEFNSCVDEEAIEIEAMNRLQDHSTKLHITNCPLCQGRVSEYRSWIGAVKLALQELRVAEEHLKVPTDNLYGPSPESRA
jgi:hypothetical protein